MIANKGVHCVGLTEIGKDADACLDDIIARTNQLDNSGLPPFQHKAIGVPSLNNNAPIRNAVISRYPLSQTESLTHFPDGFQLDLYQHASDSFQSVPYTRYSRPVLKTTIDLPNNKSFNLFVVHLKSKRPNKYRRDDYNEALGIARSAIQRNMEAAALRVYMDTFLTDLYNNTPEVATVLIGDFNDTPNSVPLENIRGPFDKNPGPANNWSEPDKRRLLRCARLHLKYAAYDDKLYSYIFNENFSLLDQAFITQHLVNKFEQMEMYNDHVIRHATIRTNTGVANQWKSSVSDHGAFVLQFKNMLP